MQKKNPSKILFKRHLRTIRGWLKRLNFVHYFVLAFLIGLGVFNTLTALAPTINQIQRERDIEKTFDQWWKDAGADQFKAVGLEPTEKIRQEEFDRYREIYLTQNPTYIIEDRIVQIKSEFTEWWEAGGGKEDFLHKHNRFPTDMDFLRLQDQRVNEYTNQFLRYNMAYTPKQGNTAGLLTSWMLFPSIASFLTFAVFFMFAMIQLERRWKMVMIAGSTILFVVCGGLLVSFLASTSFFDHYADQRYMGMSLALTFLLGATAFGPKRLELSQKITGIAIAGTFIDMAVNWFVNPQIFGAVTLLAPAMFGLGALAGLKIETRKKTEKEIYAEKMENLMNNEVCRNPVAERKAKTRALIDEGFQTAKMDMMEKAQRILTQALSALLQETPIDTALVKSLAERMTNSSLYIDIPSMQWLEWGEIAKAKNSPEAAILLLKKGLSLEKDAIFARRALFILGEICITSGIDVQEGIKRLTKVIEMKGDDMMAKQASRIINSVSTSHS